MNLIGRFQGLLIKLKTEIRQRRCRHQFITAELKFTNIPDLPEPTQNDYFEWQKYYSELYEHDSVKKRVKWPCHWCGKVFYAHYGLAIAPEHGPILNPEELKAEEIRRGINTTTK